MISFRIYGAWPDDLASSAAYRLQFGREPTDEVLRRIALAVRYARAVHRDGPWRWSGRFALIEWRTDGDYGRNLDTLRAIDMAWPLCEVVCLSAYAPTTAGWARGYELRTIESRPVPDPGPSLSQSPHARFLVPQVPGSGFRSREAFDRALADPLPPGTRTRPWEELLPVALAHGAPVIRRIDRAPVVAPPIVAPPVDATGARILAGERATLAWGPDDALAVILDGEAFPIEHARSPADAGPIATVALDPTGTCAAFVTTLGAAIWRIDLDATRVEVAAWAPAGAPYTDLAWLDDRLVSAACGTALVSIAVRAVTGGTDRPPIVARADLDAPIEHVDALGGRFVGAATEARYHLFAATDGALQSIATIECGGGRGRVADDGSIVIEGDQGAFTVTEVEAAWYRARLLDAPGGGEVAFAPGEPATGLDARGVRWHHAGGRAALVELGAGDDRVVAPRASSVPIEPGPRGPTIRVWHEADRCVVHDGAAVWIVDVDPPYAMRAAAAGAVDGAGVRAPGTVIAGGGELRLLPWSTNEQPDPPPTWSIPCAPIDLFAMHLDVVALRVVGGELLLISIGSDGPSLIGRWPHELPPPHAVWSAARLHVRAAAAPTGSRWFDLPYVGRGASGEPIRELTAETGRDAPELEIPTFAARRAQATTRREAAIAAAEAAERPVPITASSQRGVLALALAPAHDRAPPSLPRPRDGAVDLVRAGAIAVNVYRNGALHEIRVGRDAGSLRRVDLPCHGRLGAVALHPTRPIALLECGDLFTVDVATAAVQAHAPLVGDSRHVSSAAFVGADHVIMTTTRGDVALLRDTGDDLIEVSRTKVFFSHRVLPPIQGGQVVVTAGEVNDKLELCAFAIAGDRLVLVDTLGTTARHARALRAGDRVLVDVPAGPRTLAGVFELTGLDRVVAPPVAIDRGRVGLYRLDGCPPHPNRFSMDAMLPTGDPRPGERPGRWSIRTTAGLGLGLCRPSPEDPYRAYAITSRARAIEPAISGAAMRYGLAADGRRALVQVEGHRAVFEVDLEAARAHVVAEHDGYGAGYAPGGLLLSGGGRLAFHAWDGSDPIGAAAWSVPCPEHAQTSTVHDHRVLLAHDRERSALYVYGLTPRGPVPIGAEAPIGYLVAWEEDDLVYLLDGHDHRTLGRFALAGLRGAAVACVDRPVAPALCDPDLIATLRLPRGTDRVGVT